MSYSMPVQKAAPVTWVLVADGKRAHVYRLGHARRRLPLFGNRRFVNTDTACARLFAVPGGHWKAESPHIYEIGKHRMGAMFGGGGMRQTAQPHANAFDEVKQHFVKKIATNLELAWREKGFDRLVLVAPAKMIGALKEELKGETAARVTAVLSKDLTHYGEGQILKYLEDVLPEASPQ